MNDLRVLYLDLDTLRPDHLGCYGYCRNTSPHLDEAAREGVRFDRYYCSDAPCLPSRAALTTGRFGIHNGVVGHGGTAADLRLEGYGRDFQATLADSCFANIFRRAGLHTVSISPFAERHSAYWYYAGYEEMLNTGKCGLESAEDVTPLALDWIERHGSDDNWLLHINYWDAHTPYRAPASFGNPFAREALPAWMNADTLARHRKLAGPHKPRETAMYDNSVNPSTPRFPGEIADMAGLHQMIDGYDCGIAYMDSHIGRLFAALKEKGVWDDLILIISADHGENQGELGIYGEHGTADEATCRIPLILRFPGCAPGHVDEDFHYQIDLLPTLAALMGVTPHPTWEGESFAPALQGQRCGRSHVVLSQCAHVCQRSVRFGDWLYLRTVHDGYHLFPREMLYNLAEDPHEQCDVAQSRPDICGQGARLLSDWLEDMLMAQPGPDPLWTVYHEGGPYHTRGFLKPYTQYLRQTERGDLADQIIARHPGEYDL